ncbi:MAG TPA: MFS transporter [Pyrinomonadaceae bacterium]|jgi:FSR family fosmidomycin resistance protein-like MFS transporter
MFRFNYEDRRAAARSRQGSRQPSALFFFTLTLLVVEFLDELVFGVREAAWPLIRDDLRLSYLEIGALLSLPNVFGNLVEPMLGILGDVWKRRALVLGGGMFFALASLLVSLSYSFPMLLLSLAIFNPAAGAFVGLSQSALMDAEPERQEQNMARWSFSGSLGNTVGPLLLSAALALGLGWRWLFAGMSALTLLVLVAASRFSFPTPARVDSEGDRQELGAGDFRELKEGVRRALAALRRREVVRWLILLELGDFTWDILRGYLALYFVDVLGTSEAQAALAVIVWTLVGLPGDLLLIPLLERVRGLSYLRYSMLAVLVLFPAFLLVEGIEWKFALLGLLGFSNAGWYSILKAQLYKSMPGQSGTVMTLGNISGLISTIFPFALGAVAQRYGLSPMMWLLLAGPVAIIIGMGKPEGEKEKRGKG